MENISSADSEPKAKLRKSSKNKHRSTDSLSKKHRHLQSKFADFCERLRVIRRQSRFIEEEIINRVKTHQVVNNLLPPILTAKGELTIN